MGSFYPSNTLDRTLLFYKWQREYYDDLESSEEVMEEDEDMLEVMTYTIEIVSKFTWLSLRQPSGPCCPSGPCPILSNM